MYFDDIFYKNREVVGRIYKKNNRLKPNQGSYSDVL